MLRQGSARFAGNISADLAKRVFIGMQPSERGINSLANSISPVPKSSNDYSVKTSVLGVVEHQPRFKITS
jgi:hypothetical protein